MSKSTAFCTFLFLITAAQPAPAFTLRHLGLRGGAIEANLRYDFQGLGTYATATEWGPAMGVFAEVAPLDTPMLTLEVEALFTRRIHVEHYAALASPGGSPYSRDFPLAYLSFPLLLRLRLIPRPVSPYIQVGPSLDVKLDGGGTPILDALEGRAASFLFGAGVDFLVGRRRVEGELRYSHGLTHSGPAPAPLDAIRNATTHSMLILVGVGF